MKGDFSRATFDPARHYAGVLMQQGRVQDDADWNEQEAIVRRRTQIETRDVIGACGGPRDDAGFAISLAGGGKQLQIGAGRYYVDGLLAENETDALAYESQPDLPGAPDWLAALTVAKTTLGLVYLDVWERHVTPLDDSLLREVALGGPDTTTRVKTVWQARVLPLGLSGDPAKLQEIRQKLASLQKALAVATRQGNAAQVAKLEQQIASLGGEAATLSGLPSCQSDFPEWDTLIADPDRRLNARTVPPAPAEGPCVVPPTAGYRRLENQLYRVEVHTPGALGTATFKWSRDNGTVVTAIEQMGGKTLTVHDLGPDDVLGFASGQWVEIGDDASELAGEPGQLVQIDAIDASLRTITLKTAPNPLSSAASGVDPTRHPKLRRWDQSGDSATAAGIATASGWLPLEDGVEVQFGAATFSTGDYWLIPARTATGEIEWPPFAIPNTTPIAQPPRGIDHHYCRLALLSFDGPSQTWGVVEDCRQIFDPLTEACCTSGSLHVLGTNWQNDDLFALSTLQESGLRITLDGPPDPGSLTDDTVLVALDMPFPQGAPATSQFTHRVYVNGTASVDATDPNTIVWRPQTVASTTGGAAGTGPAGGGATTGAGATTAPAGGAGGGLTLGGRLGSRVNLRSVELNPVHLNAARLSEILGVSVADLQPAVAAAAGPPAGQPGQPAGQPVLGTVAAVGPGPLGLRLRVTLRGEWIWNATTISAQIVHLDGATLGRPGTRDDGSPRVALQFPSGRGVAASDFESWFIIGSRLAAGPLRVTDVNFTTNAGQASSAGDVTIPVNRDVFFKAGEEISRVLVTFNRPVLDTSLGQGDAANLFVERDANGQRQRLPVALGLQAPNVAVLILRDPSIFQAGNYILTCRGSNADGAAGGVLAADDSSALDGNFDGQPGGDFQLNFAVR